MDAIDTNKAESNDTSLPKPAPDLEDSRARRWTIAICASLLLTFAALAWSAVSGKSPTVDEGYHAIAGWLHLWRGDYRVDCEDPPLWNSLAAALAPPSTIRFDPRKLDFSNLPVDTVTEYDEIKGILYQTPGNNATSFVGRFRAAMLGVGVLLGALLGVFVWRLARAMGATASASGAAAVFATTMLALDPNFLAQSPLMKNDIGASLALLVLTWCVWSAGKAITGGRILALAIASGLALLVKFNGPLLIATCVGLLLLRAVMPWPWMVMGRWYRSRLRRVAAVSVVVAVMGTTSFIMVWLGYGLRFAPAKDADAGMNMGNIVNACLIKTWQIQHSPDGKTFGFPSTADILDMSRPMLVRLVGWANQRHLLPQAFLSGVLFVYQGTLMRPTFLCGVHSSVGTWWYFPFAMAVKTPAATLFAFAALGIAAVARLLHLRGRPRRSADPALQIQTWTALCVGLPAASFLAAAMSQNLNLGLRHVLPIYPLLFAAAGLGVSKIWEWRKAWAIVFGLATITGLAIESCCAYPNYIPFFNVMAGGSRGGLRLLSDSNLDWGQDLPLLATWQGENPGTKLYLAYFGGADPAWFGVHATNLVEGYSSPQPINGPGVIAISATILQGTYSPLLENRPYWSVLWRAKPFEVLGGSIYLFHVPPTPADRLPAGESLID